MRTTGRTILVTGGSAGIGLALAQRFHALGNQVIITGRRLDALRAAAATMPGALFTSSDAADAEATIALADWLDEHAPALDVLVNNAGIMAYHNLATRAVNVAALTRELDVNVAGPVRMVSVLVDRLRRRRGTILNVTSGLAFVPLQAAPVYCATKAAMHSYTVSLRQQLKGMVEVIELMPSPLASDD